MAMVRGWDLIRKLEKAGLIRDTDRIQRLVIDASADSVLTIYVQRVGTRGWVDAFMEAGLEVLTEAKIDDPDGG